jgi:hypothetical protein
MLHVGYCLVWVGERDDVDFLIIEESDESGV